MTNFDVMKVKTKEFSRIWKDCKYFAPKSVTKKYAKVVLDWQVSLTETLDIWIDKGINMSDGELILANANVGALVECWLRLFLCAYYEDYILNPIKIKNEVIEPENATFEELKVFFSKTVFTEQENNEWFKWIDEIQHKRNAIHSFKYREIGTGNDYLKNLQKYCEFVDFIFDRFPIIDNVLN